RNTHASKERTERHNDSREELGGHGFLIELNDLRPCAAFAVFRHETAAAVVAIVDVEIDGKDLHFQRIAGLGTFNKNRTGQDMTARTSPIAGDVRYDLLQ